MTIAARRRELSALAQADGATNRARTALHRSRFEVTPELADALDQAGDEIKAAAGAMRSVLLGQIRTEDAIK